MSEEMEIIKAGMDQLIEQRNALLAACKNCTGYRSCAKLLKRLSIDPDNPNNEAI